jgi:hypothetical protein
MSLVYNLNAIEGREEVCWVEQPAKEGEEPSKVMNPVTHAVIFTIGLFTGTPDLTDQKAADEAYCRAWALGQAGIGFLFDGRGPDHNVVVPTREDFRAHIGLHTNGSPMGKAAFKTFLRNKLFERAREVAEKGA